MLGLAVLLGAVLGYAALKFKVEGDPLVDKIDAIRAFLRQRTDERSSMEQTLQQLQTLVGAGGAR